MNTKFEEIYKMFLNSIDDYDLAEIDGDELDEVLEGYLLSCFSSLQNGIRDLSDVDIEKKEFNYKASMIEKGLLAKGMKLAWVGRKKNSQELMEKSIGDRDYKSVQGTEYLAQLTRVENALKREIDRELVDYSYSDVEYFGGLA